MKNKGLIIAGVVMVILAIVSIVFFVIRKPSETKDTTEVPTTQAAEETESRTHASLRPEKPAATYKWEPVVEPTVSENYLIITAAGGNGAWQVTEQGSGYQQGNCPVGGEIVIE